jgi:hypothetical protein
MNIQHQHEHAPSGRRPTHHIRSIVTKWRAVDRLAAICTIVGVVARLAHR